MTFLLAQKRKLFFVLKVVCSQLLLAGPIRATLIFLGLSECLPKSVFFFFSTALGIRASAYVASCSYIKYDICG